MKPITEYVDFDPASPLRISVFETDTLNHPLHYHEKEYELTLTMGSNGLRIVGDNINTFDEIDLVLLGPGIPHCWLNNSDTDIAEPVSIQVVVIQFRPEYIGQDLIMRKEFTHIAQMFEKASRGLMYTDETRKTVCEKILKLKLEPDLESYIQIMDIMKDLSLSEHWQFLTSHDYSFKGNEAESEKFERVYQHIHDNYKNTLKLTEVAKIAGMNDSAFSHYFKKRTLRSFTSYLTQLRLRYATELLENTGKKVAEICFECGFNNLANFNRQFKSWKGVTPYQWRKWTKKLKS